MAWVSHWVSPQVSVSFTPNPLYSTTLALLGECGESVLKKSFYFKLRFIRALWNSSFAGRGQG